MDKDNAEISALSGYLWATAAVVAALDAAVASLMVPEVTTLFVGALVLCSGMSLWTVSEARRSK